MLFTAVMFFMKFIDIEALKSTSEVLPEAIPRSFKCTHVQTKLARLQKNCCTNNKNQRIGNNQKSSTKFER